MKKIDPERASELLKELKYNLFTPEFVSDEEAEMLYHTILFWRSNSNAYEKKEINEVYTVYRYINEGGDTDPEIQFIFDNKEQALACAKWLNVTKKQNYVSYYVSDWHLNKVDYVEKLKKLKSNT